MRTIKFRIWNPVEKKMVESGGTPSMLSGFFHQTATLDTVHGMPYQQFTGLLDKVGKEIYEGDIVQIRKDGDVESFASLDDYIVEYRVEDASYFPAGMADGHVIGNIYESPELIPKP